MNARDDLIRLVSEHGQEALVAIIKDLKTIPALDDETLRESAKAHIQRKHDEGKAARSEQNLNALPISWSAALTWLDDWVPLSEVGAK